MTRKKCIPGIICVENMTLVFIVIVMFTIIYLIYVFIIKPKSSNRIIINNNGNGNDNHSIRPMLQSSYYNNHPVDVLRDPYIPPLRDERYFIGPPIRGSIPINISTNPGYVIGSEYRQVGLLTPLSQSHSHSKTDKILPLMGRPLISSRDKWQYYSLSDQNNSIKLPILRNGKSCTNEYGCDMLYDRDTVYVEGYNQGFKITMYENDTIKYLPY